MASEPGTGALIRRVCAELAAMLVQKSIAHVDKPPVDNVLPIAAVAAG